jgi:ADP-heptose:LPS heptosyltransferase
MLLPAAGLIRAAFPEASLDVAASTATCELLAFNGLTRRTIDLGSIGGSRDSVAAAAQRFLTLFRKNRGASVDLALDFSPGLDTRIFCRFGLRAKRIVSAAGPPVLETLFGIGNSGDQFSSYRDVLRRIGVDAGGLRIETAVPEYESAAFERLLAGNKSYWGEPLVVLYSADASAAIGSGWTAERLTEIGVRLARNYGTRLVVADTPGNKAFTDRVSSLVPPESLMVRSPRGGELVAVVARASLVITDEAGVARLASGLSVPVVELAGSSPSGEREAGHAIVRGESDSSAEEAYGTASELLRKSRTESLFSRNT